jgi:hypothetical protein
MDMYYYCTNSNKIEFITTDFSKTNYSTVLSDARNIPLENAVLLDGQLYDNRDLEYWKLLKTKENQASAHTKSLTGLVVNGIKVKTTAESSTALNELYTLAQIKGSIDFRDYNEDWHTVTVAQFKAICLAVGDYCLGIDKAYTTNIKLIEQAKTIEELKAIVI